MISENGDLFPITKPKKEGKAPKRKQSGDTELKVIFLGAKSNPKISFKATFAEVLTKII